MGAARYADNTALRTCFRLLQAFAVAFLLSACGKDGGVCVSSSGPLERQTRVLADFDRISLNDNVSLILSSDSVAPVVVEAGSHVIGGIKTSVSGGELTIGNANTCNWLRSYSKPVNVYVSSKKLWQIKYNSSGNISTPGTLKLDSLSVEIWGGCGTIDLNLDLWKGNFSLNMGTADFRLHGLCSITTVYSGDYGLYDGRELRTGYTFITNSGTNDCYVYAVHAIEANIQSIGNIYYKGNPPSVKATVTGTGKLVPM